MSALIVIEVVATTDEEAGEVLAEELGRRQRGVAWDYSDKTCERILEWLRAPSGVE